MTTSQRADVYVALIIAVGTLLLIAQWVARIWYPLGPYLMWDWNMSGHSFSLWFVTAPEPGWYIFAAVLLSPMLLPWRSRVSDLGNQIS